MLTNSTTPNPFPTAQGIRNLSSTRSTNNTAVKKVPLSQLAIRNAIEKELRASGVLASTSFIANVKWDVVKDPNSYNGDLVGAIVEISG